MNGAGSRRWWPRLPRAGAPAAGGIRGIRGGIRWPGWRERVGRFGRVHHRLIFSLFFPSLVFLAALGLVIWFSVPWFFHQMFPLRYAKEVDRYTAEYGIDPFLVMAMIKVESSFNPHARSPKGALGLLQVMPATAAEVAERTGLADFEPESDLLEPETNLRLGIRYLHDLRQEFGDRPAVVLAAYNAGRGTVRRWLAEGVWSGEAEELDRIPYAETRRYVSRVLSTLSWYTRVYRGRWPYATRRSWRGTLDTIVAAIALRQTIASNAEVSDQEGVGASQWIGQKGRNAPNTPNAVNAVEQGPKG